MSDYSGLMQGKRGIILGVANNRSIAWGMAKSCRAAGAEIALTWQGDSALYLLSDLSRGVTGEAHHVDCGYHVLAIKRPDAPDISLTKE